MIALRRMLRRFVNARSDLKHRRHPKMGWPGSKARAKTDRDAHKARAHRLSPYPNRSTEIGVVLDLMIHDLEIILHLVNSTVENIDAVGVPVLSRGEVCP